MTEYGRPCDRSSRRLWEPREAGLGGADGQQFREDARRWSGTMAMPPERPGPDVGAGSKQAALGGEKQHRDRHTSRGATWGGRRGGWLVWQKRVGPGRAGGRRQAGNGRRVQPSRSPTRQGKVGPGARRQPLPAWSSLALTSSARVPAPPPGATALHVTLPPAAPCTPHPPPGKEREPTPALRGTPHGGNRTKAAST